MASGKGLQLLFTHWHFYLDLSVHLLICFLFLVLSIAILQSINFIAQNFWQRIHLQKKTLKCVGTLYFPISPLSPLFFVVVIFMMFSWSTISWQIYKILCHFRMQITILQEGRWILPYFRMGSQTRLQGQLLNVVMRPSMLPWLFTEEQEKNACPAIAGMFDTLCKKSKLEDMTKLVSSN